MSQPSVCRLRCAAQNYAWGKLGTDSKVAQYIKGFDDFTIESNKPYAELWMGTHPSGPSSLIAQPTTFLKDVIKSNPELITPELAKIFDGDLPFLFKVLSVGKALSIQAHPDKKLGKELFEKYPNIYKDPNHKPEMAVAITEFEALCGFRPLEEIIDFLSEYPEFRDIVGNNVASSFIQTVSGRECSKNVEEIESNKVALRQLFTSLMTADSNNVVTCVKTLISRIQHYDNPKGSTQELLVRLNEQFPGDVGIFCVLMLNYIKLAPGQAMFLGANEPHAYLFGDCVECMATSDNVVRAGLTPKFKDVPILVNMLTYRYGSAKSQALTPIPYYNSPTSLLYDPPIEEFSVILTNLDTQCRSEVFKGIAGPSIFIITEGKGFLRIENKSEVLEPGSVFFVGANISITLELAADCDKLISYRAFCALK
ncbi:mannose-6-phosphate isomerase [Gigaspora rosea]|uniref:Mannose-6-phosphate isomerase n=1 Tax=Gigaspora rosea TaxID=44941 RepID=A0A397TXR8_9GLOM|nr:mannose-6-phosphate isomerase [Gigaspora rosea]CAG8504428.1 20625_t:CDS:2 [Gigaspora rosea]